MFFLPIARAVAVARPYVKSTATRSAAAGAFKSRRALATTAVHKLDIVQDMYLRQLKTYKPTPAKPSDANASVHEFTVPPTPRSPEEANLQAQLPSYVSQKVDNEDITDSTSHKSPKNDENGWFDEEQFQESVGSSSAH